METGEQIVENLFGCSVRPEVDVEAPDKRRFHPPAKTTAHQPGCLVSDTQTAHQDCWHEGTGAVSPDQSNRLQPLCHGNMCPVQSGPRGDGELSAPPPAVVEISSLRFSLALAELDAVP